VGIRTGTLMQELISLRPALKKTIDEMRTLRDHCDDNTAEVADLQRVCDKTQAHLTQVGYGACPHGSRQPS
jgi:hypothetical protein